MAAKAAVKEFTVTGKVTIDVNIPITANDFSEAAVKAAALKVGNFVEEQGEVWDSNVEITGIYKSIV